MKKAMYAISILSSLLILVMIILVMTKQEQYPAVFYLLCEAGGFLHD